MSRPIPRPALVGCLVALAALAGCGGDSSSLAAEGTRDTLPNGAERVRYGALPVTEPTPLTPALRIGAMEGAPHEVFGDVRSIEVGLDGRIYVLDGQAVELRAFDADGAFDRIVGSASPIMISLASERSIARTRR